MPKCGRLRPGASSGVTPAERSAHPLNLTLTERLVRLVHQELVERMPLVLEVQIVVLLADCSCNGNRAADTGDLD